MASTPLSSTVQTPQAAGDTASSSSSSSAPPFPTSPELEPLSFGTSAGDGAGSGVPLGPADSEPQAWLESIVGTVRERPLAALAVAVGAGLAIGWLSSSRTDAGRDSA